MNKVWVTLSIVSVFVIILVLGITIGLVVKNKEAQQPTTDGGVQGTLKGSTVTDTGKPAEPKAEVPSAPAASTDTAKPAQADEAKEVPVVEPQAPAVQPAIPETPIQAPQTPQIAKIQPVEDSASPQEPLSTQRTDRSDTAEPAGQLPSEEVLRTLSPEELKRILPTLPDVPAKPAEQTPEPEPAPKEPPKAPIECHPNLKLYILHENVAKVNDTTKFDLKVSADKQNYTYKLKDNAECIEIRFKNLTMWNHDNNSHGNNYPKEVSYYLGFDMVYVYLNDNWMYSYDVGTGTPKLSHSKLTGRPSDLKPAPKRVFTYEEEKAPERPKSDLPKGEKVTGHPDVKVTTCKDNTTGQVNNGNDFDVYKDGNNFKYYFKDGVKCLKFDYKDSPAWTHDMNEHKNHYPKSIEFNQNMKTLEVFFNNEWYYDYWFLSGRWELNYKKVLLKPGSLIDLLKSVFNIDLAVSPSLLLYFSGMGIGTIRFLMGFYPSIDPSFKDLINKIYYSDLCYESFASMTADPDKLPKVLELLKGTSLAFEEKRLNKLISNPPLLMHLVEELKSVGFSIHELLKKLVENPEKLKVLLSKMKELGYCLNETEINKLSRNKDVLNYLKVNPQAVSAAA